ncbi:MAG: cysteine desulfurase / selenocysteine lyase [Gaiellales bacterium]|jgi:cysteine desulfurase/selenocysteine lyase|nr:cysteine desulfurase / selenocysteine lyase [Gaiellales bacterium]
MVVEPKSTPLDVERIRADFPIFQRPMNGHRLVYLDSAATAQKPRQVIDTIVDVYESSYAAVHRAVYHLGAVATERYEGARDIVAGFLNAPSRREVVFVKHATEGLNLVAYGYGMKFVGQGDAIVVTEMEHHSNLVPWQLLASRAGATLHYLRLTDTGEIDPESMTALESVENVKIVAATHVSNSFGTVNDLPKLAAWAHARGAVIVADGAQAAPHRPIDVQALGVDFYALSGHKMCGPGAGAVWGREELLERMDPFMTGGGQISQVRLDRTSWNDLPWKFEPGVPGLAEAVGFGAAIEYLQAIGLDRIEEHEHELTRYTHAVLSGIDGVVQYGPPPERRAGIFSFNVEGVHPHDTAQVLDTVGVCVRAGHHCTQPLMRRFELTATARASLYLYNGADDIDVLAEGIEKVKKTFGV